MSWSAWLTELFGGTTASTAADKDLVAAAEELDFKTVNGKRTRKKRAADDVDLWKLYDFKPCEHVPAFPAVVS